MSTQERQQSNHPARMKRKKREPQKKTAERLGVSVKTVERWRELGILPPSFQINGRHYHNVDDEPSAA